MILSSALLRFVEHRDCMGMPDPIKNVVKAFERCAGRNVMFDLGEPRASRWP